MEDQDFNTTFKKSLKTWLPIAGLVLFTLLLLFIFKNKKGVVTVIVETGKDNLLSFYTDNLQPLIFKTEITNEDVFNFAVFQNLPVDKEENKVLTVGYDDNIRDNYLEIKPALYNPETNNYQKFVTALDLTDAETEELDSILSAYKQDLYSHILYDENNAIAVNSEIIEVKNAILADLMAFAQRADKEKANRLMPVSYEFSNNESVRNLRESVRTKDKEDESFIVFAPDTVFGASFDFDEDEFEKVMKHVEKDLAKNAKKMKGINIDIRFNKNDVTVFVDSVKHPRYGVHMREFRVPLPRNRKTPKPPKPPTAGSLPLANQHREFRVKLDSLSECMRNFSISIDAKDSLKHKFRMSWNQNHGTEGDSVIHYGFEYNLMNIDSLVHNSLKYINSDDFHDWEQFGFKMDSLSRAFEMYHKDSANGEFNMRMNFDFEKLEETIKEMEKEHRKTE